MAREGSAARGAKGALRKQKNYRVLVDEGFLYKKTINNTSI